MLKKIFVLTLVIFFMAGTFSAMAADKGASGGKGALQSMYDWCAGWGKAGAKSAEYCCKACGAQCCSTCNTDCGGKCCSACKKK